jgi:hypothetical protein
MCGASSSQNNISQQQQQNLSSLTSQANSIFGSDSQIFNQLNSAFSPILSAGPGQSGFTPAQLATMNSQAITQTGQQYRNAAQAAGERSSSAGGGTFIAPSGAAMNQQTQIAEAGAANTSNALTNINLQNQIQGRQNWLQAASVLGGASNVFNSATGAGNAATGSGSAAMQGATDVNNANNQWEQDLTQVISAGAGVAGAVLCPAEGSLLLMADGSEKSVEELVTGDEILGLEGPLEIEEIHARVLPIIQVCTENGYSARNSATHCFVSGDGFIIAAKARSETVDTFRGPSKVISVEYAGTARVFSIVTKGSHSYCADGVWAYGVGHVASDRACEEYLELMMTAAGGR